MERTEPADRIAETLGVLLLRSSRSRLYGPLTSGIKGVEPTTYPVLSGLARIGPSTTTRLATEIGVDRTVTTRHADRLEQAGLVARRADRADGRAVELTLTGRGRRAVAQMRAALRTQLRDVLTTWRPGEADRFADRLDELVAGMLTDPDQRSAG